MILFNLRAIPRTSNIILKLINIYENQWRNQTNEEYEAEIEHSKKLIHLENEISENKSMK